MRLQACAPPREDASVDFLAGRHGRIDIGTDSPWPPASRTASSVSDNPTLPFARVRRLKDVPLLESFWPVFVPGQPVAVGINPSIAFDHDDGTISVAPYDNVAEDLVVADGHWGP